MNIHRKETIESLTIRVNLITQDIDYLASELTKSRRVEKRMRRDLKEWHERIILLEQLKKKEKHA